MGYIVIFPHSLPSSGKIRVIIGGWALNPPCCHVPPGFHGENFMGKYAVLNQDLKRDACGPFHSAPPRSKPRANLLGCFRLLSGLRLHKFRKDRLETAKLVAMKFGCSP